MVSRRLTITVLSFLFFLYQVVAEHYGERGIAEEDKTTILKVMDSFLKDA
jgi:hypothetical protein